MKITLVKSTVNKSSCNAFGDRNIYIYILYIYIPAKVRNVIKPLSKVTPFEAAGAKLWLTSSVERTHRCCFQSVQGRLMMIQFVRVILS